MACGDGTASHRYGKGQKHQDCRDGEREPQAGGHDLGPCLWDLRRPRCERAHGADSGCTGGEAEIARHAAQDGNDAPLLRTDVRHAGGVVGQLPSVSELASGSAMSDPCKHNQVQFTGLGSQPMAHQHRFSGDAQ